MQDRQGWEGKEKVRGESGWRGEAWRREREEAFMRPRSLGVAWPALHLA